MQKTTNPLHQAVSLLARRDHSAFELKQKLRVKGHDEAAIDEVIRVLQSKDYLNEKRYAESMLRHHAMRGQGPQKIRYLLNQNQLSASLITEVFAECEADWFVLAAQAREKRFGLKALPQDRAQRYKEQSRQMRFLMSRGFDQDQIQFAMNALEAGFQEY